MQPRLLNLHTILLAVSQPKQPAGCYSACFECGGFGCGISGLGTADDDPGSRPVFTPFVLTQTATQREYKYQQAIIFPSRVFNHATLPLLYIDTSSGIDFVIVYIPPFLKTQFIWVYPTYSFLDGSCRIYLLHFMVSDCCSCL
jgi:hypothetical protein